MQPPSLPASIAIGLLAGAALAGAGVLAGRAAASDIAAPTTTTTTAPVAVTAPAVHWVSPNEAVLGPTVVVPVSLDVSPGEVALSYELVDIAASPIGQRGPNAEDQVASPELWTLLTTNGPIPGATATTRARAARFEVPDTFDPATITGARVDRWRVRMPVQYRLDIAHDDTSDHLIDHGISIGLQLILVQASDTLVRFRVEHGADLFSAATGGFTAAFEAQPQIRGIGPDWTTAGLTTSGAQLTFIGDELPDPLPLIIQTHDWTVVERPVDVDLEGLLDG